MICFLKLAGHRQIFRDEPRSAARGWLIGLPAPARAAGEIDFKIGSFVANDSEDLSRSLTIYPRTRKPSTSRTVAPNTASQCIAKRKNAMTSKHEAVLVYL